MLVGLSNAEALAQEIIKQGLNVRQVELLAREGANMPATDSKPKQSAGKTADTIALEKRLSDALGLKVGIDDRKGNGVLHIHYRNLEQLDSVLCRLEGAS